jgi:pilus assembly protein TadC
MFRNRKILDKIVYVFAIIMILAMVFITIGPSVF